MDNFNVNDVIFVISNKNQQVVPVQVVEIVVRKTIHGDETTYKVVGPNGQDQFDLNRIEGEFYSNLNEVKSILKKRASDAIDSMINKVVEITKLKFNKTTEETTVDSLKLITKDTNGQTKQKPKSNNAVFNQLELDDEEKNYYGEDKEIVEITTPDGPKKVKVNSIKDNTAR